MIFMCIVSFKRLFLVWKGLCGYFLSILLEWKGVCGYPFSKFLISKKYISKRFVLYFKNVCKGGDVTFKKLFLNLKTGGMGIFE